MKLPTKPMVMLLHLAIPFGIVLAEWVLLPQESAAEPARVIDEARTKSAGIRKIESQHLEMFTDLPNSPEVDRLPAIFDKAVPGWAAYFGVDAAKTTTWRPRAYLMADRRRFSALGLLPAKTVVFENGISIGSEMWLNDQPTDYYRRHLLLHEGTHAFMTEFLGGCGPGWYMEGTAELLATHRLDPQAGELTLGIMPRSRQEVPMLGRIKLIDDARADRRALSLPAMLQISGRMQLGTEAYAWCWAAAKFFDSHPRYRDRFHELRGAVRDDDFNGTFRRLVADDWENLGSEWQAYIATLDYGFDYERMAINFQKGKPLSGRPHTTTIAADRGWQPSGVWFQAG
jgi:hypothetical protein